LTLFVDASAMVAIIAAEPGADALVERLEGHSAPLCSPVSAWESMSALVRSFGMTPPAAQDLVAGFIAQLGLQMVPIGAAEFAGAADAYARYGKGRHKAALNMGDCFAYACAKTHKAALLYKGNDFALTDLA
jgi:ribonuclease VapC